MTKMFSEYPTLVETNYYRVQIDYHRVQGQNTEYCSYFALICTTFNQQGTTKCENVLLTMYFAILLNNPLLNAIIHNRRNIYFLITFFIHLV